MKTTNHLLLLIILFSANLIANGQSSYIRVSAEGQKYNEKDQEFVYNLWLDSTNTIVGSVIQENKSPDKDWCAYLKVSVLARKNMTDSVEVVEVFATTPYKLEAGKENSAKTNTQKVKWKLKNGYKPYALNVEQVTSCIPFEKK